MEVRSRHAERIRTAVVFPKLVLFVQQVAGLVFWLTAFEPRLGKGALATLRHTETTDVETAVILAGSSFPRKKVRRSCCCCCLAS